MLERLFRRRERKSARRGERANLARKGDPQRVIRRFFRLLERWEREGNSKTEPMPARRNEVQT